MNAHRSRDQLVAELIELITNAVNLQHIDKTKLNADTPLTYATHGQSEQPGLGLDSVDLLEAVVVIEHRFGVKIENADVGRQVFKNFGTVADHILTHDAG